MKKQFLAISCFLYILFSDMAICAQHSISDSTARISIQATGLKHKTLQLFFRSTARPVVTLDSTGFGTVVIPIKEPLFVDIGTDDSTYFELLMEPGYDITCTVNNGLTKLKGTGCVASIYLLQAKPLLDSLSSATNEEMGRSITPEEFLRVMQDYELKFTAFHKHFNDSLPLSFFTNKLLQNRMAAALLLIKQRFIIPMDLAELDSLDLERKLGLLDHGLLKDSLFIRTGHSDLLNYLIWYNDLPAYRLYLRYPDITILPLLYFGEVYKDPKYSRPVKEYLLYCFTDSQLAESGINSMTENLCDLFYKLYPASEYTAFIKKHVDKLTDLVAGNPAPSFRGKTVDGKTLSLSDFKGKLLLIDVWATWCGPCKTELPYTQKIQKLFKEHNDFSVLYISVDSDALKWKNYLAKNTWLTGNHLLINNKTFDEAYKITGIPRYMLIDKTGRIIDLFLDNPSKGKLEGIIKEHLKK